MDNNDNKYEGNIGEPRRRQIVIGDIEHIGKSGKLQFNVPEFEIKREDNTNIRSKVASLTPEDRKRLGINKSTLWYMQKHIKEDKRIKVYGKVMEKL